VTDGFPPVTIAECDDSAQGSFFDESLTTALNLRWISSRAVRLALR
jgi:hypothetical protein